MTDERFLDIEEKVNSIEYCLEEGIEKSIVENELKSFEWLLNKEVRRYYKAFNKADSSDILKANNLTLGIKKKITRMLSILYKIGTILDNRESY